MKNSSEFPTNKQQGGRFLRELTNLRKSIIEEKSRKWGFDFENEKKLVPKHDETKQSISSHYNIKPRRLTFKFADNKENSAWQPE